jgi:hypothetical protein
MKGGFRYGSGAKPGVRQPRVGAALMRAAKQAKRSRSNRNVELTALYGLLADYRSLAETAKRVNDAEAFRIWSERIERVLGLLLQHQLRQPAAGSPKVTNFTVSIFKDGKPLNIVSAPAAPVIDAVAAPVPEPALAPEPAPQPESPRAAEPLVTPDALAKSATLRIANQHNEPMSKADPPSWVSRQPHPYFALASAWPWHGTRHHR